ncbi:DUF5947 family protein [Nonomuraea sp. B12E4]|uniref:DUF5947 family protein n=1 Tax=Nonomuraea sp. B12E4 TaxID=3153564 RepID=UPI00325E782C
MSGRLRLLAAQAREREQAQAREREEARRPRCELCGEPLPADHRHLLELPAREPRCACRACQVLFDHAATGAGHYRLLPDRRLRLSGFTVDDPTWARLRTPVRMVFLVHDATSGEIVQFYPSPAGPVRATVDRSAWDLLRSAHPEIAGLLPDVEALLLDRDRGAWIVPVDDCYALAGTIRAHWRGLTGGPDVREHISRFFTDLDARCVTVPAAGNDRSPA